jgi:hypothetical protein
LENSLFFAGAVVRYSPGFNFVAKGVMEPVKFIDNFEMMLLMTATNQQLENECLLHFKHHE